MKHILFLIGLVGILFSCNKDLQPLAKFTLGELDKNNSYTLGYSTQAINSVDTDIDTLPNKDFIIGDTIHLKNYSLDASSYVWTLPDGTYSSEKELDFIIPYSYGSLNSCYIVKLEAFSKNKKKSDENSLVFDVLNEESLVTFLSTSNSTYDYLIIECENIVCPLNIEKYFILGPHNYTVKAYKFGVSTLVSEWTGSFLLKKNQSLKINVN